MKRVKHFFAPCMELLTWPELKSTFLFSVAAARQGFRLFITHLWWLFPIIFVMLAAINQTIMPILSKFKFFDVVGAPQLPQLSVPSFVVSVLIASFCEYFFSFVAILLMRPSREAKDWNYLISRLNDYFVPSLILFPAYLVLSRAGFFSAIWAFSMFFFMDDRPSLQALSASLPRGFWACIRFFPVVFVVYGLSSLCLAIVALALALIAGALISGALLLGQLVVWVAGLVFMFFAIPMVFFHLAIINTVYVKIMNKYRGLFFDESQQ